MAVHHRNDRNRQKPSVRRQSHSVWSPLRRIASVRGPLAVQTLLGLPLADLGAQIGRLCGREAFSKQRVSEWNRGVATMSQDVLDAYGILLANWITRRLGGRRTIGIKLQVNSPWYVTAWTECDRCDRWYEMHAQTDRLCESCRSKARRPAR